MTKKELLARIEALEMRLAILESEKWSAVPAFPAAPPIPWWNQWYCSDTARLGEINKHSSVTVSGGAL